MMLSILIPTIPDRRKMFLELATKIDKQIKYCKQYHPTLGEVEMLFDDSKKFLDGGLSIGKKREGLLQRAKGKYSCFVDDDEDVSPDYVETILRMCQDDVDIIVFKNFSVLENYWMVVDMDLDHTFNHPAKPGIVHRRPWHICPVKRELAIQFTFPDSNYGEDWQWFEKVLTLCKTQHRSGAILHKYHHGIHSEANKIINHV